VSTRATRALLAAALGAPALHAHASKFPVAPLWAYFVPIAVMLLASVIFAFRLARVCHPSRSRVRHAILGAILGPVAVHVAAAGTFLIVFLPLSFVPDSLPGGWLGPVLWIGSALVFLALMFVALRISSRYSASEVQARSM
jgi:hypothetical protein